VIDSCYSRMMIVVTNTLHAELKEKTHHYHQEIEQVELFKKITDQTIVMEEYISLIKTLYGFIYPCERLIQSHHRQHLMLNREKTQLLEQDMLALQVSPDSSVCTTIPNMKNDAEIMGYLYVMEGATLGGQIIKKILEKRFPLLIEKGIHYFGGYGNKTKTMWDSFCENLNLIKIEKETNNVIKTACLTYECLHNWIEKNERNKK
jgi:heme oxygenase